MTGVWRKSSYSNPNGNCVEASGTLDSVRDSKRRDGSVLAVSAFGEFVRLAKAGRFDRKLG